MKNYDWIVIGGGITGSALSYELSQQGFKVLLLEKDAQPNNATCYSYGGIAYWAGTTQLTRQLCHEGIEIHRYLTEELGADTEFRELDLLLTIDLEAEPKTVEKNYSQFAIAPQLLSIQEACQLEPLLNPHAISGVLRFPHGHIHPQKTNQAYQQAFLRLGGKIKFERVTQLLRQENAIQGVATSQQNYYAERTVVCTGGLSRFLLQEAKINAKIYFTHAQLIKTPPVDIKLRTLVMPASQKRLILEAKATHPQMESLWNQPSQNVVLEVLEPGAVQFLDGSFRLGQISQILTSPEVMLDSVVGEAQIRTEIGKLLPLLRSLPGTWHRCLVAFANHSRPLVGKINHFERIYLFSGLTSTILFAPPLARHFAHWVAQENDEIISQLSPI